MFRQSNTSVLLLMKILLIIMMQIRCTSKLSNVLRFTRRRICQFRADIMIWYIPIYPPLCHYTLSGLIGKVVASHAELQDHFPVEPRLLLFILCTRSSRGTAHEGGGSTSKLDLPSLTPLYVAGCGRLQLGVPIGLLE